MKMLFTKVTALLLLVWYSLSIIGFDVHTCNGNGESFIVTFVEGFECVDIHPEHHCHKGSCCSGHHDHSVANSHASLEAKSCCSSDYQVLALTGVVSDEKNSFEDLTSFVYSNYISSNILEFSADVHDPRILSFYLADSSGTGRMPDAQSVLSVWRI